MVGGYWRLGDLITIIWCWSIGIYLCNVWYLRKCHKVDVLIQNIYMEDDILLYFVYR